MLVEDDENKKCEKVYLKKPLNEKHLENYGGEEYDSVDGTREYRCYHRLREFNVQFALEKKKSQKVLGLDCIPIEA